MFRLFRRSRSIESEDPQRGRLWADGDGEFSQEIVGESFYQDALYQLAGPKRAEANELFYDAFLICERSNPHDPNAVSVNIRNRKVGHLSRKVNYAFRLALSRVDVSLPTVGVDAVIVGGWKNERSEDYFGVFLDMTWPVTFFESDKGVFLMKPLDPPE